MKRALTLMAGCLLILTPAFAGTVTSMYGLAPCFNLPGVTSCHDGSSFVSGLGGAFFGDYRTAAQVTANSVAEIWAAPGSISFKLPSYVSGGAVSATLSLQIAGIADIGGPYSVLFDGTSVGSIPMNSASNASQDVLTYSFTVPVGLLDGADTIAINGTAGDGYILGYAKLTVTNNINAAPEPTTFGLLLMGGAAFAAGVCRRQRGPRFS